MPETTVTYVIQRLRLKQNGGAHAEGWKDWSVPFSVESVTRDVLASARDIAEQLAAPDPPTVQYRLVKVEETREVIE